MESDKMNSRILFIICCCVFFELSALTVQTNTSLSHNESNFVSMLDSMVTNLCEVIQHGNLPEYNLGTPYIATFSKTDRSSSISDAATIPETDGSSSISDATTIPGTDESTDCPLLCSSLPMYPTPANTASKSFSVLVPPSSSPSSSESSTSILLVLYPHSERASACSGNISCACSQGNSPATLSESSDLEAD